MGQFSVREYCEEDEDDLIAIHDLARPVELQGSCDPRAFVPLRDDAKDLDDWIRQCCERIELQYEHKIVWNTPEEFVDEMIRYNLIQKIN